MQESEDKPRKVANLHIKSVRKEGGWRLQVELDCAAFHHTYCRACRDLAMIQTSAFVTIVIPCKCDRV